MINKEKLIKWCWENLQFHNAPKNWEDTYIIDILNGYKGSCHDVHDKILTYNKIRLMFEETDEEQFTVTIVFNTDLENKYNLTHDIWYNTYEISESFQDDCIFEEDYKNDVIDFLKKDSVKHNYNYYIEKLEV